MSFSLEAARNRRGVRADASIFPALTGAVVHSACSIHMNLVHGSWFSAPGANEIQRLSSELEGVQAFHDSALSSAIVKFFSRHYHGHGSPGTAWHLSNFCRGVMSNYTIFPLPRAEYGRSKTQPD
jgi:hypothetical protein